MNILVKKGVITLEEQYVDGTKIESKANKYTFVWKKTVQKNREKLLEKAAIALKQLKKIKYLSGKEYDEDTESLLEKSCDIDSTVRSYEQQLQSIPEANLSKENAANLALRLNTYIIIVIKCANTSLHWRFLATEIVFPRQTMMPHSCASKRMP